MYNRYIPQPDGSFSRNRIPDQKEHIAPLPPPSGHPPTPPKPEQEHCKQEICKDPPPSPKESPKPQGDPLGFLSRLLPKDFDTGDLIVVLLLLLLAGDCEEDRTTALLTLALYFVM